ncbi:MAG: hypothetical protein ABH835_00890 [Patescibacteria group bacterium]
MAEFVVSIQGQNGHPSLQNHPLTRLDRLILSQLMDMLRTDGATENSLQALMELEWFRNYHVVTKPPKPFATIWHSHDRKGQPIRFQIRYLIEDTAWTLSVHTPSNSEA